MRGFFFFGSAVPLRIAEYKYAKRKTHFYNYFADYFFSCFFFSRFFLLDNMAENKSNDFVCPLEIHCFCIVCVSIRFSMMICVKMYLWKRLTQLQKKTEKYLYFVYTKSKNQVKKYTTIIQSHNVIIIFRNFFFVTLCLFHSSLLLYHFCLTSIFLFNLVFFFFAFSEANKKYCRWQ